MIFLIIKRDIPFLLFIRKIYRKIIIMYLSKYILQVKEVISNILPNR